MSEGVGASRPRNNEYRSETVQNDPSGCADDKQADFVDFSRYLAHIIPLAGDCPYTELCQKLLMQASLQRNFQPSSVHG